MEIAAIPRQMRWSWAGGATRPAAIPVLTRPPLTARLTAQPCPRVGAAARLQVGAAATRECRCGWPQSEHRVGFASVIGAGSYPPP